RVNLVKNGNLIVQTQFTVAGGFFQFNNVGPGSFQVQQDLSAQSTRWVETTPASPPTNTPPPAPNPPIVTVSGGRTNGLLFGDFQQITIQGVVFNDVNGNGFQDASDAGIANVPVYIDLNNVGFFQPGIDPTVTTNNFGVYT